MRSRMFWAGLFFCLAAVVALAQDPVKVAPKHYKRDFENERVDVISVHYGPHEVSALHEHPGGVVVSLTEAHLRFTDENGKSREVFSKPGEVRWYPPFKHRVENLGDTAYDGVYIGVKGKLAAATTAGDTDRTVALDEETKRALLEYALTRAKP